MATSGFASWPGWETVKLIGRGSFGAVYEIQRDVLGEKEYAALKVITIPQDHNDIEEMYSDGYNEDSITETFKEHLKSIVAEYSLMRKMGDCKNIVKCDDVRYVQHENGIGWDIFIKMELLTPLTKYLSNVIHESTVIKLAKDMCSALAECKKHDVIHRDIKPQNIFVSANGDFKLGDFGIAKLSEKTSSGTKIGTYKYMAPEVYNNQPYGSAADIYSLGLVLYWMLNERRMPFLPTGAAKITASIEDEARVRRFAGEPLPTPINGSIPLKAVVLKACAYNPADRYKSPHEMLAELNSAVSKNANTGRRGQSASQGQAERESAQSAVDLDVKTVVWIAEDLAKAGCVKNVEILGVGTLSVKIPAGTQDRTTLRLRGAGKKNPVTGAKGNAYITIMYVANKPIDEIFGEFFGGKDCVVNKHTEYSAVISSKEAKKGCNKTFSFKNGSNKTVQIPAGCQNGQVVNGIQIYVHDFSSKEKNLEKLPNAVINMYANKSSGLVKGIVWSFVIWMIFGMTTMQIPIMAGGLLVSIVFSVARGIKRRQTIDEAKRILKLRQAKTK